jgi:hypothetical protein
MNLVGERDLDTGVFAKDDAYFTEYVTMQVKGREFAFVKHGERNYNFAPGAPVCIVVLLTRYMRLIANRTRFF